MNNDHLIYAADGTSDSLAPSRTLVRTCATLGEFARYASLKLSTFFCADCDQNMQAQASDEGHSSGGPSASRISSPTVPQIGQG